MICGLSEYSTLISEVNNWELKENETYADYECIIDRAEGGLRFRLGEEHGIKRLPQEFITYYEKHNEPRALYMLANMISKHNSVQIDMFDVFSVVSKKMHFHFMSFVIEDVTDEKIEEWMSQFADKNIIVMIACNRDFELISLISSKITKDRTCNVIICSRFWEKKKDEIHISILIE